MAGESVKLIELVRAIAMLARLRTQFGGAVANGMRFEGASGDGVLVDVEWMKGTADNVHELITLLERLVPEGRVGLTPPETTTAASETPQVLGSADATAAMIGYIRFRWLLKSIVRIRDLAFTDLDRLPVTFPECPTCAAKPGSPTLCEACRQARDAAIGNQRILDVLDDFYAEQAWAKKLLDAHPAIPIGCEGPLRDAFEARIAAEEETARLAHHDARIVRAMRQQIPFQPPRPGWYTVPVGMHSLSQAADACGVGLEALRAENQWLLARNGTFSGDMDTVYHGDPLKLPLAPDGEV